MGVKVPSVALSSPTLFQDRLVRENFVCYASNRLEALPSVTEVTVVTRENAIDAKKTSLPT